MNPKKQKMMMSIMAGIMVVLMLLPILANIFVH
jgi:hypothetical protein